MEESIYFRPLAAKARTHKLTWKQDISFPGYLVMPWQAWPKESAPAQVPVASFKTITLRKQNIANVQKTLTEDVGVATEGTS